MSNPQSVKILPDEQPVDRSPGKLVASSGRVMRELAGPCGNDGLKAGFGFEHAAAVCATRAASTCSKQGTDKVAWSPTKLDGH
jgi:hypothetical protein